VGEAVSETGDVQGCSSASVVAPPIAAAGYSFVRFIGGAVAPYLAARLGEIFNPHVPFFVGAATIVLALVVLLAGNRQLGPNRRGRGRWDPGARGRNDARGRGRGRILTLTR
jgi:hypothetical protein